MNPCRFVSVKVYPRPSTTSLLSVVTVPIVELMRHVSTESPASLRVTQLQFWALCVAPYARSNVTVALLSVNQSASNADTLPIHKKNSATNQKPNTRPEDRLQGKKEDNKG